MKKKLVFIFVVLVLALSLIYTVSASAYPQVDRSSFDQLYYKRVGQSNFETIKDGDLGTWLPNNPQVYDKKQVTSVGLYGWAGQLNLQIDTFGYNVDGGPFIPGNFTFNPTEPIIKDPQYGGPYASRFLIEIPIAALSEGNHTVNALVKLTDGNIYNICSFPFSVTDTYPTLDRVEHDGLFQWINGAVDQTLISGPGFPAWHAANPFVFSEKQAQRVSVYGWTVPLGNETIKEFGYAVNGGPFIWNSNADDFPAELAVNEIGGPKAKRYFIHVPTLNLTEGSYHIKILMKTTTNKLYEMYSFSITITERALVRAHIENLFRNNDFWPTLFYTGDFAPFGIRTSHLDPLDYFFSKEDTFIVNLYGWMQDGVPVNHIGYKINDGPIINNASFKTDPEPTLIELAGPFAMRFNVSVPVSGLPAGIHKVAAWATLSNGETLEISSFSFILLDTDTKANFIGNQIRRTLVPHKMQNGNLNWSDMRQGLRFLFKTPEAVLNENSTGTFEIVKDGALVSLFPHNLSFEEMHEDIRIQDGLIDIDVNGVTYKSAYVYNIPKLSKDTIIYARPYIQIKINGQTSYIYGDVQAKSVTSIYKNASGNEDFTAPVIEWWDPAQATPVPDPTPVPTPKPTTQPIGEVPFADENIDFANLLANKVQAYYGNPNRTNYIMTNTQMVMEHNLTASGNKNVTSLKTTDGKVYLTDTMDAFIENTSGTTYYASKSSAVGRMNTLQLGFYYYETHIRDLRFRSSSNSNINFLLDRTFHTYSDKLHQELKMLATASVSNVKDFGFEAKVLKTNVAKLQYRDKNGTSNNISSIDQTTVEYVAFDIKNTGVVGFIIPPNGTTKKVTITDEGGYYVVRQYANLTKTSYVKNDSYSFSHRVYTDTNHTFDAIDHEAYLERHPMTGITITGGTSAHYLGYDHFRGAYKFTMHEGSDFIVAYHSQPDKHHFADIKVTNGNEDRQVYIWLNTMYEWIEGGAVLDENKLLMPIPVQVGKNFHGDGGEPVYSPNDVGYGDTFIPLNVRAQTTTNFTLMNLYQNWGRFPLKQISSIEFHISYYHLSTGVTESNCIAPYFVYDKDGWTLPDFRGASGIMWPDQPQFNSVGRLYFTSYLSGSTKIWSEYTGSLIRSAGLTYADMDYSYIADNGAYEYTLRHVEFPQLDENRTYYSIRLDFLKDTTISDMKNNFSIFTFDGRFTTFKQMGYLDTNNVMQTKSVTTTRDQSEFIPLGNEHPYFSYFDLDNGADYMNFGLIVKNSHITYNGGTLYTGNFGVKHEVKRTGAFFNYTNFSIGTLTLNQGSMTFKKGDVIYIDMILLPYGTHNDKHDSNVRIVREDSATYPITVQAATGQVVADSFLPMVRAANNEAQFTVTGGRNNMVVRVDGFTKVDRPIISEYVNGNWINFDYSFHPYDGYTVHYNEDGTYGFSFVFTMPNVATPRTFLVKN